MEGWTDLGRMFEARIDPLLVQLTSGHVLAAGGTDPRSSKLARGSAELLDPGTGQWSPLPPMTSERAGATATLLADGRVLVTGGSHSMRGVDHALASAELFDPVARTWQAAAPMNRPRQGHAAVHLPDGHVLVVGASPTGVVSAELYDPAMDTWEVTAPLAVQASAAGLFVGPAGDALLVAGDGLLQAYSPGPDLWRVVGEAALPSGSVFAARLDGTSVLVGESRGPGSLWLDLATLGTRSGPALPPVFLAPRGQTSGGTVLFGWPDSRREERQVLLVTSSGTRPLPAPSAPRGSGEWTLPLADGRLLSAGDGFSEVLQVCSPGDIPSAARP